MSEKRIGRQTPTLSVVLPYTESLGSEALEIYNRSGRAALEWQELMLEDIMAVNDEGLWLHMKFQREEVWNYGLIKELSSSPM